MATACPTIAQEYCIPNSALPYSENMPGITAFSLNTINRVSDDLENYPGNSYVDTELSTELLMGETYEVSITHTIDAQFCPDMNLRVWIDFDQNFTLNDEGETVVSIDHHLPGTYMGEITIPNDALAGQTKMRVAAKMSSLGGHTLPTPCDGPPDPIGFHGEFEDYWVHIIDPTASPTKDVSLVSSVSLSPNPAHVEQPVLINFGVAENTFLKVEIIDVYGRGAILASPVKYYFSGDHQLVLNAHDMGLSPGMYFVLFSFEGNYYFEKLMVY